MVRFRNIVLYFLAISFLIACKARVSLSGATIPPEAKTISVAFFTNNTSLGAPSLSLRFTEKLRDVVSQQTPLSLVRQNGDLQFEGFISDYNVAPIAVQSNDQAAQNRMTITVNVKYTNSFDATKSFEQNFTRFSDFDSKLNVATEEPRLVDEIYRQITEDVFYKAFNNW